MIDFGCRRRIVIMAGQSSTFGYTSRGLILGLMALVGPLALSVATAWSSPANATSAAIEPGTPSQEATQPTAMTGATTLVLPALVRSQEVVAAAPPPPPAPAPEPADILGLEVSSAGVSRGMTVEPRGTVTIGGSEYFDVPSHPSRIAWYPGWGQPGTGGSNSILSAHLNYFGYGSPTPFANLDSVSPGDPLSIALSDGSTLNFTIKTSQVISESTLNRTMFGLVYPNLSSDRERITLITCAGNFVQSYPGGPGVYQSRLVVTAERIID